MGFFEDASKKIETAFNTTSSKAKDYTEKRKLENNIRSIENSKKSYFAKIGEMIYQANEAGEEAPGFEDILDIIRDLDHQIEEKKERIEALNDQFVCSTCGRTIPNTSKFCPYCGAIPGAEQNVKADETVVDADYVEAETKGAADAAEGAGAAEEAKMKLCPSCGHTTDVNNLFCPHCGEKISE